MLSTASDPQGRPTVIELVDSDARLYPVGRLDADSSGLVLLTNDGELANRLMHPRYEVPRTYRVQRVGLALEAGAAGAAGGRRAGGRPLAAPPVSASSAAAASRSLEVTIHEGRNRIVRRMFEAVGYPVRSLERVAFGPLELGRLRAGNSRRLRPHELDAGAPCRRSRGGLRESAAMADAADNQRLYALRGAISIEDNTEQAILDGTRDAGAGDHEPQRARRRADGELRVQRHHGPQRAVPRGRRARPRAQPRAAAVHAGDRGARLAASA